MTCFRGSDRGLDRLKVTHLAHEDDVGVLSEGSTQRLSEARNVVAHFSLVHDRFLVLVVVLDRVFHGHDVVIHVLVHIVDHGRQRGRLAGPCRPRDKKQPTRTPDQILTHIRQPDLIERQEPVRDLAKHDRDIASLTEYGYTESGSIAVGKAEVGAPLFLKFLLVAFRRNGFHERNHVVGIEHLGLQVSQPAMKADSRLPPGRQVEVRTTGFHDGIQQAVNLNCGHISLLWAGS